MWGSDYPHAEGTFPISRRIVEHFGGRMWLESDAGQGACFAFTLEEIDLSGRDAQGTPYKGRMLRYQRGHA